MAAAAPPAPVVLVLGASGMLGRAVHKALMQQQGDHPPTYRVVGTGNARAAALGLEAVDVTDAGALSAYLARTRPALLVNCVAERRPDRVEQDEAHARRLNVGLVEALAEAAAQQGFHLIHISTDYVFDGTAPPYAPDAAPHPLNAYGRHKLQAEEAIRKHPTLPPANWLILRVPVLYGESHDLDESSITALAKDVLAGPDKPKRVDDWSARFPTHTADVAEVLRRVVVAGGLGGAAGGAAFLSGTHHFSSKERQADGRAHTKYTLSLMIGGILGRPTAHLASDPNPPAGGAARPKNCELDVGALAAALGPLPLPQTPLEEGLATVLTPLVG